MDRKKKSHYNSRVSLHEAPTKNTLQNEVTFVQPLPKNEIFVDYNKRPVNLMGYTFCELEVDGKYIRKAKILVARPGAKSIVDSHWLNYLHYPIEPKEKDKLFNSTNFVNNKPNELVRKWTEEMQMEISRSFRTKWQEKTPQEIRKALWRYSETTERLPRNIPLQESVNKEVDRLIPEGHIVNVQEIREDVFIQPMVITVRKDRSVKTILVARKTKTL